MLTLLAQIEDPELPVSLVDLGIVDEVTTTDDGAVTVKLVFTMSSCPFKGEILQRVRHEIAAQPGVTSVRFTEQIGSRWTPERMSSRGRAELRVLQLDQY